MLSLKLKLAMGGLSLAGLAIVLVSTARYGAGLSEDSVTYISVARNLVAGRGFVPFEKELSVGYTIQPPLYPLVLALGGRAFRVDPLVPAHLPGAIFFAVMIYLSGMVMAAEPRPFPALPVLGSLCALVSRPLVELSVMAWSEPLFITLWLLFFLCMQSFLEKGNLKALIGASVSVALACLTRYAGVTLVLTGLLAILLLRRRRIVNKIRECALFGVLSLMLPMVWLVRNWLVSQTLFGFKQESSHGLLENLRLLVSSFLRWFVPERILRIPAVSILCGGLALLVLGGLLVLLARLRKEESRLESSLPVRLMGLTVLFVGAYCAFLVVALAAVQTEGINLRYSAPAYLPVCFLCLWVLGALAQEKTRPEVAGGASKAFVVVMVCLFLAGPASWLGYATVKRSKLGAGGYNQEVWREGEIVQLLQQGVVPAGSETYSNSPWALYLFGDVAANVSPGWQPLDFGVRSRILESLRDSWPKKDGAYLVWFDGVEFAGQFTVAELSTVANFATVVRARDGAIYQVSKAR